MNQHMTVNSHITLDGDTAVGRSTSSTRTRFLTRRGESE